ncbi:MAG: hypothetical protein GY765_33875, partial [bacterium]|nr:hypothetical protein [bacterium]
MKIKEKIKKNNVESIMALTPLQEGMLFHYSGDSKGDGYLVQLCLELEGRLDVDFFRKAWEIVVRTNGMLRTLFRWKEVKQPVQMHMVNAVPDIRFHDLSHLQAEALENAFSELKGADKAEGFRLEAVPFRVTLCKMTGDAHQMVVSHHHIIYDGWSTGIILKEFFGAYTAFANGNEPTPASKIGFIDFVRWINGRDKDKERAFWGGYLRAVEAREGLSIKGKHGGDTETSGAMVYDALMVGELREKLDVWTKTHRVTLAAFLYAAWGVLLQVYNDSDDVLFGTTVSGRSAKINGIEEMVGLFINTLPLRVDVRPGLTVAELTVAVNGHLQERE